MQKEQQELANLIKGKKGAFIGNFKQPFFAFTICTAKSPFLIAKEFTLH